MQPQSCSLTRPDLTDSILQGSFHGEPPVNGTAAGKMRTEPTSWNPPQPIDGAARCTASLAVIAGHHKRRFRLPVDWHRSLGPG